MGSLLAPLEFVVSWIMIGWHWALSPVLGADSGATWSMSIIGLVIVVRILLIPLFVKQIISSRKMQLLQPQVREIQKKYAGDREKQGQATMALYKESKTNPLASCLPILLQAPVFFALFRVLNGLAQDKPYGAFVTHPDLFQSAANATLFGAGLSDAFKTADSTHTQIVAAVLVAIMTTTTFLSQLQLMRKNMPAAALEGPFATQQKVLLYLLPATFLFSGYNFPIGVVLYWCISNIWTMGQQFFVIRRMPSPGTPAEEAYERRKAAKAAKHPHRQPEAAAIGGKGTAATDAEPGGAAGVAATGTKHAVARQQPKKTSRNQRKRGPAPKR